MTVSTSAADLSTLGKEGVVQVRIPLLLPPPPPPFSVGLSDRLPVQATTDDDQNTSPSAPRAQESRSRSEEEEEASEKNSF